VPGQPPTELHCVEWAWEGALNTRNRFCVHVLHVARIGRLRVPCIERLLGGSVGGSAAGWIGGREVPPNLWKQEAREGGGNERSKLHPHRRPRRRPIPPASVHGTAAML
jgi:hypothetical protein